MMEFTISRVVLCIGGLILLSAVSVSMSAVYETDTGDIDDELVDRIAGMLDRFESSDMDVLILDGPQILPEGRSLSVHDCIVELYAGDSIHTSITEYSGEFSMDCTDVAEVSRRTSLLSF